MSALFHKKNSDPRIYGLIDMQPITKWQQIIILTIKLQMITIVLEIII